MSADKLKLIRQQAILLRHASTCNKQCRLPYCAAMKTVLVHLQHCQQMVSCPMKHCTSSRRILEHKACIVATCPICGPTRNKTAHDDTINQSLNLSQLNQSINLNDSSVNLGSTTIKSSTAFVSARDVSLAESSSSDVSTTETDAHDTSGEEVNSTNNSVSYAETTAKENTSFYSVSETIAKTTMGLPDLAPSPTKTNEMEMTAMEKSFLSKLNMVQSTPIRPVSKQILQNNAS